MKISRPTAPTVTPRAPEAAPASAPASPAVSKGWVAKSAAPRAAGPDAAPADVVRRFYEAFEAKDVDAMEQLYAPNLRFQDAIFSFDDAAGAAHMWRKLFQVDPHAKLSFTLDSADGATVKGHWVADYHVGGRPVHNEVSTTMRVEGGKIVQHTDDFSWKKWAPQAFPAGRLFTLPGLDALAKGLVRAFLG
ncbi:MAG: nuclear transport factor 2 family protein [Myxococcota bacterium]